MKKQLLLLMMMLLPMVASADDSGTCGDNLTWTFVESTGTLTISGTGAMKSYNSYNNNAPWYNYRDKIITAVIEDGVASIGNYAFYICTGLTNITIPNSVTSIESNAFKNCTGLTNITIPDGVASIGSGAFDGCTGLTSVTISVSDLAAFYNNTIVSLVNSVTRKPIILVDSEGKEIKEYNIPEGVTSIRNKAFQNCTGLTTIVIPSSVTSIGSDAFRDCTGLTSVTIPDGVARIGDYAFSGCTGLTSVTISVSDLAAFYNGKIVSFVNNIIGKPIILVDSEGKEIKEYNIPEGVTSIGNYAFKNCTGLTNITIPNSVTSIGEEAFYGTGCYNNQPDGVIYVDKWVIGYKGSLTGAIILDSGTVGIADKAFYYCGLTSITIPNSVTILGTSAFQYCSILAIANIGNSVTSIGTSAFYGCSGLKTITIPNSVTEIGSSAFQYCSSLTSAIIGSNVQTIGDKAFYNCYRLNTISSLNPVPPTVKKRGIFECETKYVKDMYDIYNNAILNVPAGCKEAYASSFEWCYFEKIKENEDEGGEASYANLTIQQGTLGYTRLTIKAAERHAIYISPLGEHKINTVTFNGADVTREVVNGYYTTPVITGESVLSISYETDAGISAVIHKDVKVSGYNGEIKIANIDVPTAVYVYSVDGMLIGSIPTAYGSANMLVTPGQIYVVKVGTRTYKIAM